MNIRSSNAGRVDFEVSGAGSFWTFFEVRDRLVDALRTWWRMPDSDDRFGLGGRISSIWAQYVPKPDLIDRPRSPRRPRPLPPSRADIGRMLQATEWIVHIPEKDRHLVMQALAKVAAGRARVPWKEIWEAIEEEGPGPTGLRMRFNSAITAVATALNG